jgi:hypothetical protein
MGLLGWIGWTEAPVSTVAWAALDGVDYKMTPPKHVEYQNHSVGGIHRLAWPRKPDIGVLSACVYNERDSASVAWPRHPSKLICSRVPHPKYVPANFRRVFKKLTLLFVNLGKWLEEIRSYFVVHAVHGF